jgi:predicted GNAT superfamily acetyltransferase
MTITLLPPSADDEPAILTLNNAHAVELSLLDPDGLRDLLAHAYHARVGSDRSCFLIAFDQQADYASPNFLWFRERCEHFVYVDRVVVSAAARGRGLARLLYDDLFAQAAADRHRQVYCEVNLDPPNIGSERFHEALGFNEVGRATLPNGKTVKYLLHTLAGTNSPT